MAAITGVYVIYGKQNPVPDGYIKIEKDLNKGAGGEYVYLCYTTSAPFDPITDIQVFAGHGNDADFSIQTGYTMIKKDLNKGAKGRYIYVCYSRDRSMTAVTGLDVVQGSSRYTYPGQGWIRINQDCSEGAEGNYTYICKKH